MSASFFKDDKYWLLNILSKQRTLTKFEEAMLISNFDSDTVKDIETINKKVKQVKLLKKACLVKVLVFIPEYILCLMLFNKKTRQHKSRINKLYLKFLFNKINVDQLKNQLKQFDKNSII